MEMRIQCPSCKTVLKVPDQLQGKQIGCSVCKQVMLVKGSPPAPPVPVRPAVPLPAVVPPAAPRVPPGAFAVPPVNPPQPAPRPSTVDANPFAIDTIPAPPPKRHPRLDLKAAIKNKKVQWIGLCSAAGVLVLAIIIAIVVASRPGRGTSPVAKGGNDPKDGVNQKDKAPGQNLDAAALTKDKKSSEPVEPIVSPKPPPVAPPAQIDVATVEKVKDATVYLRVTSQQGQVSEGSGFFTAEPGIVVTNAHVVGMLFSDAQPKSIQVVLHSGEPNEKSLPGVVLGTDRVHDLAAVRVESYGMKLPAPLDLDSAKRLFQTQKVILAGFPLGKQLGSNITVNDGTVSALRKDAMGSIQEIQINGSLMPGNSGGPLVDTRGIVVGIAVRTLKGENMGFAVPADRVPALLHGQVQATEIGEAFREGNALKLPVRIVCTDPLQRLREVKLEVWLGKSGVGRPESMEPPASEEGDSPKQTIALSYKGGVAKADIDLPVSKGKALWLRPVLIAQGGNKLWAAVEPFYPQDERPLERRSATIKVDLGAAAERTVQVTGTLQFKSIRGKEQLTDGTKVEATLLEAVQPTAGGARLAWHPGDLRFNFERDGITQPADPNAQQILRRTVLGFHFDATGVLLDRDFPGLLQAQKPPFLFVVEDLFNLLAQCCEMTSVTVPVKQLQPLETWSARLPLFSDRDGRRSKEEMELTCTYEGQRVDQGRNLAFIRVAGRIQLPGAPAGSGSKLVGQVLFDLDRGYIGEAQFEDFFVNNAGGTVIRNSLLVTLKRQPGNTNGIAKLNVAPALVRSTAPAKTLLALKGVIAMDDPRLQRQPFGRFKEHFVQLSAGVTYSIDMISQRIDSFLFLEDDKGVQLAFNDDDGGALNARIVFTPQRSGTYRIIATVFVPQDLGEYALIVSEVSGAPKK